MLNCFHSEIEDNYFEEVGCKYLLCFLSHSRQAHQLHMSMIGFISNKVASLFYKQQEDEQGQNILVLFLFCH